MIFNVFRLVRASIAVGVTGCFKTFCAKRISPITAQTSIPGCDHHAGPIFPLTQRHRIDFVDSPTIASIAAYLVYGADGVSVLCCADSA
jgi:hypothetical protein